MDAITTFLCTPTRNTPNPRAGEKRFEPGPLWDLDLAYRLRTDGSTAYAMGFKDETGWLPDFYQVPEFMRIANRIYQQEMFPLIQNVLLGEEKGRYLRSLDEYIAHIAASEKMNDLRWTNWRKTEMYFSYTYEGELWQLRSWIDRRSRWMSQVYEYLAAAPQKYIELWAAAPFVSQTEKISFVTVPWQNCSAELLSACQLTEATEDSYARWQAQAKITALDGGSLEGYTVSLNGTPLTASAQEDGTLMICFEYDDQSYRPVDYYGQDVGRIYQYERYIEYYPEIAKALDYDEESVMDYFFDEGIYEGQAGNEFFEAREIAWRHPDVEDYLGEEWDMYYWEYLDWGYDAEWLPETHFCYLPQVSDAEKTR